MLKIFTDRQYICDGMEHIPMLYPFWGNEPENSQVPQQAAFEKYIHLGDRLFQISSLEDCDAIVVPVDWSFFRSQVNAQAMLQQLAERAANSNKQLVFFFWNDSTESIPIQNSIVFRTSLYRSASKQRQYSLPFFTEDIVDTHLNDCMPIRQKQTKPIVGFCGLASSRTALIKKNIRHLAVKTKRKLGLPDGTEEFDRMYKNNGHLLRAEALARLSKSNLVTTNFILRDKFFAGAVSTLNGRWDLTIKEKIRREYIQNTIESDYILCVRGSGNYSHRFYETLCCGKIPIFIDTDCVLPYDFEVDWKKYCVWIEEDELPVIAEKVAEFHERLSPQDFLDLQHDCRKLWQQWLSPEGFFSNFHRHFI